MRRTVGVALLMLCLAAGAHAASGDFLALYYSGVSRGVFAEHMDLLKSRGYTAVGIEDVAKLYSDNRSLPDKAFVILIAGQRDTYLTVKSVIKQSGLKAAIVIDPDEIRKGSHAQISWHDVSGIAKDPFLSVMIAANTEKEAVLSRGLVREKFKSVPVHALLRNAGVPLTDEIKRSYPLSFVLASNDGRNTGATPRHSLSAAVISPENNRQRGLAAIEKLIAVRDEYRDDFSARRYAEDWLDLSGDSRTEGGMLHLKSGQGKKNAETWLTGTHHWDNAEIVFDYKLLGGEQFWLYLRYRDADNYIRVGQSGNDLYIQQKSGGTAKTLRKKSIPAPGADMHRVRVSLWGSRVAVSLDEAAAFAYTRSLDTALTRGKIGFSVWGREEGEAHCRVDNVTAMIQKGRMADSVPREIATPDSAAKSDPFALELQIQSAKALYRDEQYEAALNAFNNILAVSPDNIEVLKILADDALNTGNDPEAYELLAKITAIDSGNVSAWNTMAKIASGQKRYEEALKHCEKSLSIDPRQPAILFLRANAQNMLGNYGAALNDYDYVLGRNPNNTYAKDGLIDWAIHKKNWAGAEQGLDGLMKRDPRWSLRLKKANILAWQKKYGRSIGMLRDLSRDIRDGQTLLVLLYHGVTQKERSPILRASVFREHMAVLKEEGYRSVSAEDIALARQKKKKLPEKAVYITFDDGRADSFENAGPILKEFGYTAAMFVPVCKTGISSFFCDWDRLKMFRETGLWEIQSHAYYGHEKIDISSDGVKGLFLVNRKWLAESGREENDQEYRGRVERDFFESKKALHDKLGATVTAFSFPEGDSGNEGYTNHVKSPDELYRAMGTHYALGFTQDSNGFNLIGSDDPLRLKRISISPDWTREEFREHIRYKTPDVQTKLALAETLRQAGRFKESLALFKELDRRFEDNSQAAAFGQARIYRNTGNYGQARVFLGKTLFLNPDHPSAPDLLLNVDHETRPSIKTDFAYFADENDRETVRGYTRYSRYMGRSLLVELGAARGRLQEEGVSLDADDIFVQAAFKKELATFQANCTASRYESAYDAVNYFVEASAPLFVFDSVIFRNGYERIDTARAVLARKQYLRNSLELRKNITSRIRVLARHQYSMYSDSNQRNTTRLIVSFPLWAEYLSAGYEMKYDTTQYKFPEYYCPDGLTLNALKIRLVSTGRKKLAYELNYGAGHVDEEGASDKIVHTFAGSMQYEFTKALSVSGGVTVDRTAVYGATYSHAGARWRF